MNRPTVQPNINWKDVLENAAGAILEHEDNPEGEHKDEAEYMFEAVMIAVYGDDVFDYLNAL